MITFKAHLVSTTTAKKIINKQDLKDVELNFVRLNPSASEDVVSLNDTCYLWGNNAEFANRINTYFQKDNSRNLQFFAITEQSQNFNKLNPKQILGLAQTSDSGSGNVFIEQLQVSPEHNHYAKRAAFKNLGTSIVDSIKKLFSDKDIFVCPATLGAELFYLKTGFRPFLGGGIMRFKR